MIYKVKGITCNACKKIIEMDLEESGLSGCSVDVAAKTISIPQTLESHIDEIAAIIATAGNYTLEK